MNKYLSQNKSFINIRRGGAIGSMIVNDFWTKETEFDTRRWNIYLKKKYQKIKVHSIQSKIKLIQFKFKIKFIQKKLKKNKNEISLSVYN